MESKASVQSRPVAGLLAIPKEIRLKIYNHLFHSGIDCPLTKGWRQSSEPGACFHQEPDRTPGVKLKLPWVSLMLSCSTIADEIRGRMQDVSFQSDPELHTWELDIRFGGSELRGLTWKRVPCLPDQMRTLVANLILPKEVFGRSRPGFRGCGGYYPTVWQLFQTLNHIVHLGPCMDPRKRLERHMRIPKLAIYIRMEGMSLPGLTAEQVRELQEQESYIHENVNLLITIMTMQPMAHGFVDAFEITSSQGFGRKFAKEGRWVTPCIWRGCQFDWGFSTPEWSKQGGCGRAHRSLCKGAQPEEV